MEKPGNVVSPSPPSPVTQRGHGRQFILASDTERQVYLDLLLHAVRVQELSVGGYGLI